jgi:hypothetical protein
MRRLLTIIYIVFCLELGIFLFILPWAAFWSQNYFTDHLRVLSGLSHNNFLRGAVSGLGLADIWLAILEIWHLIRPAPTSDPSLNK